MNLRLHLESFGSPELLEAFDRLEAERDRAVAALRKIRERAAKGIFSPDSKDLISSFWRYIDDIARKGLPDGEQEKAG